MRKEKLENVERIDIWDGMVHFPIDKPDEAYIRDEGVEVVKIVNGQKFKKIYASPYYKIAFKKEK